MSSLCPRGIDISFDCSVCMKGGRLSALKLDETPCSLAPVKVSATLACSYLLPYPASTNLTMLVARHESLRQYPAYSANGRPG